MHLLLSIILISICFFRKDWKKIHHYHLTILYVIICDLLYNLLCADKLLWKYNPDFFHDCPVLVDILHSFINLPSITLLFLANYPNKRGYFRQIKYILQWIAGSLVIESLFLYFNRIELINGYKAWMEILFYTVMYVMLRLHHLRPLVSYLLSAVIIIFLLLFFKIPLTS